MEPIKPTTSGIVTTETGERHIPESKRADGSTRKAIKIRPGYQPPEDVAKFRIKSQQDQSNRPRGVPGAEGLKDKADTSAASTKNAKRREARKKAKAAAAAAGDDPAGKGDKDDAAAPAQEPAQADPAVEKEKKARNLRKKLKQARELKSKKEDGGTLLPEQLEKVIKINQLIQDLEALGFEDTEAPKAKGGQTTDNQPEASAAAPA